MNLEENTQARSPMTSSLLLSPNPQARAAQDLPAPQAGALQVPLGFPTWLVLFSFSLVDSLTVIKKSDHLEVLFYQLKIEVCQIKQIWTYVRTDFFPKTIAEE